MNPPGCPSIPPVNGQPPFTTPPGGVNPDPLALLQLTLQNYTTQLAWLSVQPRLDYTIDGITANWEQHQERMMSHIERLIKIPGVAPTIEGPYAINQFVNNGWGWGPGW
jgi:hypothetical protein